MIPGPKAIQVLQEVPGPKARRVTPVIRVRQVPQALKEVRDLKV